MSFLTKQTPEFHWVITLGLCAPSWTIRDWDKHSLIVKILSMCTKMTDGIFELYAEDLLALTREQFNDFRQADMIRMIEKPSSPP